MAIIIIKYLYNICGVLWRGGGEISFTAVSGIDSNFIDRFRMSECSIPVSAIVTC